MKIWEILKEENVGKIYDVYNGISCCTRIVIEGNEGWFLRAKLIKEDKFLEDEFSLGFILRLSFKEYIDWTKVPVDTKILVRNSECSEWNRRYFAKYENGKVYAWDNGRTSWSAYNEDNINVTGWGKAKLYEGNEE